MEIVLAVLGGGAITQVGNLGLALFRNKKQEKRADRSADASLALKFQDTIDRLIERVDKQDLKIGNLYARIDQLEEVMIAHDVPIPPWKPSA